MYTGKRVVVVKSWVGEKDLLGFGVHASEEAHVAVINTGFS